MKTTICVSVFLVVLCQLSSAVIVTEGDSKFSLDSVKALGALMTGEDASAVCSNPKLPEVFKPLCLRTDADASLTRLAIVVANYANCEICEYAACTGCSE